MDQTTPSRKEIRPAPSGIDDWWNTDIDFTIHPRERERIGMVHRPFSKQEEEAAMDALRENGFS